MNHVYFDHELETAKVEAIQGLQLEQLKALNLSESSMDKFFCSNAARVFGFD